MKIKLTTNDVDSITEVAGVMLGKIKSTGINFRGTSKIIRIACAVVSAAALFCVLYYVATHRIGPLMVFVAAMIPILAYGLGSASKSLDALYGEFDKFAAASKQVIATLGASPDDDKMDSYTQAISAVLYTSYSMGTPLEEMTLDGLKKFPTFNQAVAYAEHLCVVDNVVRELEAAGLNINEIFQQLSAGNDITTKLAAEVEEQTLSTFTFQRDSDKDLSVKV